MTQTATWTIQDYYKALKEGCSENQTALVLKLKPGLFVEIPQTSGCLASSAVLPDFSLKISDLFNFPKGISEDEQPEIAAPTHNEQDS